MKADTKTPLITAEPWTFVAPDGREKTVEARLWFDARALAATELQIDAMDLRLRRSPL